MSHIVTANTEYFHIQSGFLNRKFFKPVFIWPEKTLGTNTGILNIKYLLFRDEYNIYAKIKIPLYKS